MFSLFCFYLPTPSTLEIAKMETKERDLHKYWELETATWRRKKQFVFYPSLKKLDEQFFKLFMTHIVEERTTKQRQREAEKKKCGILLFVFFIVFSYSLGFDLFD
jgi:hypothetical protein